jgi:hypothetical protein
LAINKDVKRTVGYVITVCFELSLHSKDIHILKGLQAYFGVGGIYKQNGGMMHFKVSSVKDIVRAIIPHFIKYPLVTQKRADFEIFKRVIDILSQGPLPKEELQTIVNLRASLNRGLSSKLQAAFPETVPVERPVIPFDGSLHPLWVVGFSEGEGNFHIKVMKTARSPLGVYASLRFALTQHSRDEQLLQGLIEFFGCGIYLLRKNGLAGDFIVNKFEDLDSKIIPFFLKYPLQGSKLLDFKSFCLGAKIIREKGHLTSKGLDTLLEIKSGRGI